MSVTDEKNRQWKACVFQLTYFLQKVRYTFTLGAFEAHGLEEFKHIFTWPLIHNVAIRQKDYVIKQIICLWCRLQQGNDSCATEDVGDQSKWFHYLVCGRTIQASGDFIHEQCSLCSNHHLTFRKVQVSKSQQMFRSQIPLWHRDVMFKELSRIFAIPVVTRLRCPPEIPLIISSPTMVSAQMSSPKICKVQHNS